MNLLTFLAVVSVATQTAARYVLPRNMRSGGNQRSPLKELARQVRNYEEEEPTPFENSPWRKFDKSNLRIKFKNLAKPKYHQHLLNQPLKSLQKPMRASKLPALENRLRTMSQYDSLFDKNGMLYLTLKKNTEDRKFNALLNKVVMYKVDGDEHKYLRKPLASVFNRDELDQLRTVVDAVNADGDVTTPKVVFDFNELVI